MYILHFNEIRFVLIFFVGNIILYVQNQNNLRKQHWLSSATFTLIFKRLLQEVQ